MLRSDDIKLEKIPKLENSGSQIFVDNTPSPSNQQKAVKPCGLFSDPENYESENTLTKASYMSFETADFKNEIAEKDTGSLMKACSSSFGSTNNESEKTENNIGNLMKDMGQEAKMTYMRWSAAFYDSESFEELSPKRVDTLIKEALAWEESLKKQKEYLRQRLYHLTKALQSIE